MIFVTYWLHISFQKCYYITIVAPSSVKVFIIELNFILLYLVPNFFAATNMLHIYTCLFSCFQESSISILREDEEDDAEVGDILNDEEINNILEDDDDDE